jgi:hypothetical protein
MAYTQPISIVENSIVTSPQVKQPCLFNQVCSMMPFIKLSEYLCGSVTGENVVGVRGERGRERKRTVDKQSEKRSVSQKQKWRGLEMAVSEKGHLSIFNKTNQ